MAAEVKVNFSGHCSSPVTLRICLAVGLPVDQLQRVHTLACSDLHSTSTMCFLLAKRGREKKEELGLQLEFGRSCLVAACPGALWRSKPRGQRGQYTKEIKVWAETGLNKFNSFCFVCCQQSLLCHTRRALLWHCLWALLRLRRRCVIREIFMSDRMVHCHSHVTWTVWEEACWFLSTCVCLHVKGPHFHPPSCEKTSYKLLSKSQRGDVLLF